MRISDWSSDVCSSDLEAGQAAGDALGAGQQVGPGHGAVVGVDGRGGAAAGGSTLHQQPQPAQLPPPILGSANQIGRASCRARVCQYVSISVVALTLKKKEPEQHNSIVNKSHNY